MVTTDDAPEYPPVRLVECRPDQREPATILFNVRKWRAPKTERYTGWLYALDRSGRLTCFLKSQKPVQGIRYLPSGNLLVTIGDGLIQEMALDGEVLRQWIATGSWTDRAPPAGAIAVDTQTFHHGVNVMPGGNMLILGMEIRELDDWPGSTTDPHVPRSRQRIVGDIVLEVAPDGTKVHEWKLLDILDPYRITYGSRDNYWQLRGFTDSRDWSHANGTAYDASDDSILVSLRTQDAIIKLDRKTGTLKWILGAPENWREPWASKLLHPDGDVTWNSHQHDCSVTSARTVLCFDNGNYRAQPFAKPLPHADNTSRAVEFAIDERTMTARQVWSFGAEPKNRLFAGFQGGAVRMPRTGNTFVTYGGICRRDGRPSDEAGNAEVEAKLLEVTPTGQIVLDLRIGDVAAGLKGYYVFRSELAPPGLMIQPA
jgi:arylsulfate sulfotransferase